MSSGLRRRSLVVALGLVAWAPAASAVTYTGGDQGGADLVLADGDELLGVFTNVGELFIPTGARVTVTPLAPLEVYADTITIDGLLDGTGAGHPGGAGAMAGAQDGEPGEGLSGGEGGEDGPCIHGGGGGGGGYGGEGGQGGHYYGPQTGFGGLAYGNLADPSDRPLGSGGGGAGSDCYHPAGAGARGGGSILLAAPSITVSGAVRVDGVTALDQITGWSGAGGGGSGGSLVVYAGALDGGGQLTARGGEGGSPFLNIAGFAGGGGGGAGGRVKVYFETLGALVMSASGGVRGVDQAPILALVSTDGDNGTVHVESAGLDLDGDGSDLGFDNCPFDANPSQDDTDGDGLGDVCDACPLDVDGDSDLDGVCDSDDVCAGFDDNEDLDGDGAPDDCDPCPSDLNDDSDGDGVCDSGDVCAGDDSIDTDLDGVPDDCDVCPTDADPDQLDRDLDGFGDVCDCAPDDAAGGPGLIEVCDGVDNDCDELVDEAGAEGEVTWYADRDSDGQGDGGNSVVACDPPVGFVDNDRDCNDSSSVVGPFQAEFCDGLDNDCDGVVDPPELQCDGGGEEAKGCGCSTPTAPAAGWLLLLGPLLLRRRRVSAR